MEDETASRATREYLATLDDAAFGAASDVMPKFVSPSDPESELRAMGLPRVQRCHPAATPAAGVGCLRLGPGIGICAKPKLAEEVKFLSANDKTQSPSGDTCAQVCLFASAV